MKGIVDSHQFLAQRMSMFGNVRATVSDRKVASFVTFPGTGAMSIYSFSAEITSAQDYYPFGWTMPGRQYDPGEYRYSFQGQEGDDEIKGAGNSINYKYRMHDPRIGRFLSLDPLAPEYPHNSPYAFSENRVIDGVELEGLEYMNSTSIYSESAGVSGGLGYGGSAKLTNGNAWDMIGLTSYRAQTLVGPSNQNLDGSRYSSGREKPIIGGEFGVNVGGRFAYDKPTFDKAMYGFNTSLSGASVKLGVGGGVEIGDNTFGIQLSIGLGAALTSGPQSVITEAMSVTYSEAQKVSGDQWSVRNQSPVDGGFKGELYGGDGQATGIMMYSGVKETEVEQEDGSMKIISESNGRWKSSDYKTKESSYNNSK